MHSLKSTFALLLSISIFLPATTVAQSGRGRPVTPGRETKPVPAPTVIVPEATTVIKQEQAGSLSRFALKNGITVVINEQHALPVAAAVAYFKVGAIDEADGAAGVSSLLARVMRRGTQFRGGEKLASDMRAVGGLMESEAAFDHTSFRFVAPADKIKEALAVQADLLQNPLLAEEDVKQELALHSYAISEGVASAMNQNDSLLAGVTREMEDTGGADSHSLARLATLAFAGDKAGRALQASPALTREQLLEFYRAHYRPDNLVIAVSGAVSTFNTLVEIQRLYGTFKKQEPQAPPVEAKPGEKADNSAAGKSKSTTPSQPQSAAKSKPQPASPPPPGSQKPAQTGAQSSTEQKSSGQANPTTSAQPPAPGAETQTQAPVEALRYANERGLLHQSIVSLGFRLAGLNDKDRATVEVLSAVLGEGRGSRLHRSLFAGQSAVNGVESSAFTFADRGLLAVQVQVAPNAIDKAESALFRELNKLRRELPTDAEIARAQLLIENRFFEQNAAVLNRARFLARAEATAGFRSLFDYQKRIRAVTAEDVQRAAAKFLTLANTAVHEYEAASAPPRSFDAAKFAQTVTAWSPTFAEAVDPKQVRASDDKSLTAVSAAGIDKSMDELSAFESIQPLAVKNFSTLNGPPAYVREDHTQPRITAAVLFQGGRMVEDETNAGITELMLHWMLYGTAKRPQAAIELEQLGARLNIVAEPDYYGIVVDVFSNNADAALKLTRDLIEEPAFRDEDFKLARTEQTSKMYNKRDSAFSRSRELLAQSLFAGHVFAQPTHGSEEAVMRLKEDDVREWYAGTVKGQMPLIVIVGDTEGSALLSSDIATGFKRNETAATLRARVPQAAKPGEKIEARGFAQTVFAVGFPGAKGGADELFAFEVMKAALNGDGGLLDTELRDRQGVAYDAYFDGWSSLVTGAFYFVVATAPESEQRARAALISEVDKLSKAGLAAEAFTNAKAVARTAAILRLQSQRERALEYARRVFYQKQAADVDAFEERLSKVTVDEVKRAAAAYFKTGTASLGMVRGSQK